MSKRLQKFERAPRGFYPTPWEAFEPLISHLPAGACVAEPCAGDGTLCHHIDRAGMQIIWAADIEPRHPRVRQCDATKLPSSAADKIAYFITNPPWPEPRRNGEPTLSIAHRLSALAPTWLLLPADFMHNVYAGPAMAFCHQIVSVGRVKWMPDTDHQGFDNCAWYLFDQSQPAESTVIVPRQAKRRAA